MDINSTETELRFLVKGSNWKKLGIQSELWQGYISTHYQRVVRIRTNNDQGFITFKGEKTGDSNFEKEFPIDLQDALEILRQPGLLEGYPIHKIRHLIMSDTISWAGVVLQWEVDEFLDDNAPLAIAEIELVGPGNLEELAILRNRVLNNLPDWIGLQLDFQKDFQVNRYFGSNLAVLPFSKWSAENQQPMLLHLQ